MDIKNYKGACSIPQDFDTFWDEKLEFINKVILEYEIEKTEFSNFENVEYYNLYFKSFDGARIYAKYIKPKTSKKCPALFYFHGCPGCNRNWFEKTAYASLGYAVFAMDFRGQGGRSEDIGGVKGTTVAGHVVVGIDDVLDNMIYIKNILDMCLLVRIAKELDDIDEDNISCAGGSQGGGFSVMCAGLNPDIKKCIILYPFLSDMKKVYDLDLDLIAYESIRYYSRWFSATGANDERLFNRLAYFDAKNFAHRIKAKVLFGASNIDMICPIETQFSVYNNMDCEKELILYKKYGHENIPDFNTKTAKFLLED
ncbi:acetylxylan esterase [Gemella cuniculi]|uniref:acetylxylan esterase n=1 Tax=Gemella cuniculi TaxID=150240 RepID=UPI00040F5418|nr:alpha/beta fold hydrolase [Gemella cuniculi]